VATLTDSSHIDLHTHSTASDGALSPGTLVEAAASAGVTLLALTDHDTTDGLADARAAAHAHGVRFVPGVEVSTSWQQKAVHITGLGIDPDSPPLRCGLNRTREIREQRAEKMGQRLDKAGFPGALAGAQKLAGRAAATRSHFARHLVAQGYFDSVPAVFRRVLVPGKPGYVPTSWAQLDETVGWIRQAGGIAVVAHLMRYRLTGTWRRRLLGAFRTAGGEAMEVVCGNYSAMHVRDSAAYAVRFGLKGVVGSDFHGSGQRWLRLGQLSPMPPSVRPVWEQW
jgi:3',5'-nucleoside bisphosphate phosphatase